MKFYPPFQLGQRVEYRHSAGPHIFRGNLIRYLCADRFYAVVEAHDREWVVRSDRLRHVGSCK